MKKLIIGIALIIIMVLCLSNISRVTEFIYDEFYSDISGVTGGNTGTETPDGNEGSTGTETPGGNEGSTGTETPGGNEGNTGTETPGESGGDSGGGSEENSFVVFESVGYYTDKNYLIDPFNYEKHGDWYYYPVFGDSYARCGRNLSERCDEGEIYVTSTGTYLYRKNTSNTYSEPDTVTVIFDISGLTTFDEFASMNSFNLGYLTHKQYFIDQQVFSFNTSVNCEYSLLKQDMYDSGGFVYLYAFTSSDNPGCVNFFLSLNTHSDFTQCRLPDTLYLYSLGVEDAGVRATPIRFVEQ